MARNVLVIQADQFRADCLGVAGNPDVRTPNLDRLAGDGVRSTLRQESDDVMTTLWERDIDGEWGAWMPMRFVRGTPPS